MNSAFLSVDRTRILRHAIRQLTAYCRPLALFSVGMLILANGGCGNNATRDDNETPEETADETAADSEAPTNMNLRTLKPLNPGIHNQWWQMNDQTLLSFCLSVPEGYDPDDKVPLILYLHHGANVYTRFFANEMLGKFVLPVLGDNRAIVVAPDIVDNTWFGERTNDLVMALLEEVGKTYSIDRQRVLVMGYSIGANGTWHFSSKYPDFFTAGLSIAGGPLSNYAEREWVVPMMCVQSADDEVFPASDVRKAVEELQKKNAEIQLQEINDVSHYSVDSYVEPCQSAMDWIKQVWARKSSAGKSN